MNPGGRSVSEVKSGGAVLKRLTLVAGSLFGLAELIRYLLKLRMPINFPIPVPHCEQTLDVIGEEV